MVQTELQCGDRHLVSFLPKDKRVKKGTRLSLKGNDAIWTITKQYPEIDSSQIQRGWDVGGIESVLT
jgi:hypothetical protein